MPVYHFPTKEEREQLIREMQALAAQDPAAGKLYQEYAAAIAKLDARMAALSKAAADGLPPLLTKQDADELQGLITAAATAGEQFLAGEGVHADEEPDAPLPGVVNRLQNMLSRDFKSVSEYDPKSPKSLPELQEDSRGLTIDLRNRRLDAIGNLSNQRHFMTVVDGLGRKRSGVFTKAVKVSVMRKFTKVLEDAKAQCGDAGKAELDKLIPGFKKYILAKDLTKISGDKMSEQDPDSYFVGLFLKFLHDESLTEEAQMVSGFVETDVSPDALKHFMKRSGVDLKKISGAAQLKLIDGLNVLTNSPANDIQTVQQELEDGAVSGGIQTLL